MKKVITYMCICVLAISYFCLPCFAVDNKYPLLPEQTEYVLIEEYDGDIYAYAFDSYRTDDEYLWMPPGTLNYIYTDNRWEVYYPVDYEIKMEKTATLLYDNTGYFGIENVISWEGITTYADFRDVITKATDQISVKTVVEVLAWIALAVVGLVFMWWGGRKLTRALMTAFRKGKVSV